MTVRGSLFAIKRFSLHDGPHLRTTIFFKGCPLQCVWCHNPEGISTSLRTISVNDRCVGCGECIEFCPRQALSRGPLGVERDVALCDTCGECVRRCPALVHEMTGYRAGVDEVMAEIVKDTPFYDQAGGGVTFSGGEPLGQPEFLMALLSACQSLSIHRTVDTSAYASPELLLETAERADLILCDIKHMDSTEHKKYTGVGNERILANIRLLAESDCQVRVRLPLIPGINDGYRNIVRTIDFIKDLEGINSVDILPYHRAARAKYEKLGVVYPGDDICELSRKTLEQTVALFEEHGLTIVVGG